MGNEEKKKQRLQSIPLRQTPERCIYSSINALKEKTLKDKKTQERVPKVYNTWEKRKSLGSDS